MSTAHRLFYPACLCPTQFVGHLSLRQPFWSTFGLHTGQVPFAKWKGPTDTYTPGSDLTRYFLRTHSATKNETPLLCKSLHRKMASPQIALSGSRTKLSFTSQYWGSSSTSVSVTRAKYTRNVLGRERDYKQEISLWKIMSRSLSSKWAWFQTHCAYFVFVLDGRYQGAAILREGSTFQMQTRLLLWLIGD